MHFAQYSQIPLACSEVGDAVFQAVNYGPSLDGLDFDTPVLEACYGPEVPCTIKPLQVDLPCQLLTSSLWTVGATPAFEYAWENRESQGYRAQFRIQLAGEGAASKRGVFYVSGDAPNFWPAAFVDYQVP